MRTRQGWRRYCNRRTLFRTLSAVVLVSSISACGGGDSGGGGGIIGTGIEMRGTVPTNRQFADSSIGIKAASGERTTGVIGSNGRFVVDGVLGTAPYLLRVDLGNDDAYYGIAHNLDGASVTQNVHAYSDLAIRNWFATEGLDIDAAFNSTAALDDLPSESEIEAIDASILDVLREALTAYGLSGTDLSTVSFDSDDLGVDQFLDRNPVLINNGSITIIISEPENDTQTVVSSNLPINTDLTASDDIPPSAPTGLRVLPSASDEIVLVWDAATDNVAVSGYQVIRDGVVIATTAFPLFVDSPLDRGVVFTYNIVAVDAAGNPSLPSESGSGQTLEEPDTVAPPIATDLTFVTSNDSIVVRWTQSSIADVASFRVLRGEGSAMLDQIARVTSTALTDGGLNSGTEYCYQVITSDASENESEPSEIECTTTTGTDLSGGNPNPGPGPGVTEPPVLVSSLLEVDVSGLSCETELETLSISEIVVLDEPCYRVTGNIDVNQNGQLIVEAGTVLKFDSGHQLQVNDGGSLAVNGTEAAPVVFSAVDPTPGIWDGVHFRFSNSTRNELNNLVIEFGGQSSGAGLLTTGFTSSQVRLSLNNVLVRGSVGDGVALSANTIISDFNGFISTGNARSASAAAEVAANFGPDSRMTGNAVDALFIENSTINSATTWQKIDVPFLTDQLDVNAPLAISEGSEVRFESGGSIAVGADGSLSAVGTASEPIVFTGTEMTPGYWRGIQFRFSNSTNNRLEHAVIEYAGSLANDGAGVYLLAFSSSPARLAVSDVVFRNNDGPGFRITDNATLTEFSNVVSSGNGMSGVVAPLTVGALGSNLDLQGNTVDGLSIIDGTLSAAATWPALNVPYLFDNLDVDAVLTVAAGASFIADGGASIEVTADGALNAVGTAASPITFVGAQSITGHWDGISYRFSNNPLNVLDFVTISNGGSGGASNATGNISVACFSSSPSLLSISNSTISESAGFGIHRNQADCGITVGANVTFSGNLEGDINTP
ncbi:MAG: fibronectin type III domain-containing protein [Granulosicoccus sp.]